MDKSLTAAVMQPYLFPYIGYFQLIAEADVFVFYDDVNFINRGWINRNNILLGGKAHLITLPLQQASQNKRICEIAVAADEKTISKFLRTIQSAYARAPFFSTVFPMIEKWMQQEYKSIAELNGVTTKEICRYLGITTRFVDSSAVYGNDELKGQHRVLDICLREKATRYINPVGGMELYDRSLYESKGIGLFFLRAEPKAYPQGNHDFVPYLSILDYLMFLPPREIGERLKDFSLLTN